MALAAAIIFAPSGNSFRYRVFVHPAVNFYYTRRTKFSHFSYSIKSIFFHFLPRQSRPHTQNLKKINLVFVRQRLDDRFVRTYGYSRFRFIFLWHLSITKPGSLEPPT